MRFASLAALFARAGTTVFGGGDPAIAMLRHELVAERSAISDEQYGMLYALARVTPGTNMLAFCAGAGYLIRGWLGALVAATAVSLPGALIAVILVDRLEVLVRWPVAAGAIAAMLAAAVGVMAASAYELFRPRASVRAALIAGASFALIWYRLLGPVEVLALAAVVGYWWAE